MELNDNYKLNHPLRWETHPERINALKNMTPRELSRRRYDKDGNRKAQTPKPPVEPAKPDEAEQANPSEPVQNDGEQEIFPQLIWLLALSPSAP